MTREEAIELLDNLTGMVEDNQNSDYDMALKMAIKALEQAPCEELFDNWREAPSYAMTLEQAREAVHELRKEAVKLRREASEWQQDHAILKAHSDGANEVIDRIKKAITALDNVYEDLDGYDPDALGTFKCRVDEVFSKLIAEVEGTNEAN